MGPPVSCEVIECGITALLTCGVGEIGLLTQRLTIVSRCTRDSFSGLRTI